MSVFLDTSALYPLVVRSETQHEAIGQTFRRLLSDGQELWTTSYVLLETLTLLQNRIGLAPVRDVAENVVPVLSVEWVGEGLHRRGLERLIREDRRRLSLVDCVSFEFMMSRGLRHALALDTDFVQAGFRLVEG